MSTGAILCNMDFDSTQFTALCFGSFDALLFLRVSFLFLLDFVLFIEG
jgi:hypothetical protein